ncbi:2-hydroxy-3-oxopropionate reductase [Cytobacillus sp. FSL H8-0458]|uniref:2-hydroxy-3-oxopropionate reductase n=1 Tax=Cytobacillus sp. FSL H8-0458 TaxID=2975346 RepID=UPI0030FC64CB
MIMNIGFIGLGIMGKPMAINLMKDNYKLSVYDINTVAVEELESKGAFGASSPKEVAERSNIVITMLPNSHHVESVVFGENSVIEGAKEDTIIVDMSSITPAASKNIANKLAGSGIHFIDAPVSGGELRAIDGTLSIMAGGKEEIFDQVKPILSCMGQDIVLVGDNGCGVTAKLANQVMVNVNIATMAEALMLAAKAGIDIEKMYQAIRGGFAGSAVLDAKLPTILNRDFTGGGRVDINLKDLTNVVNTAHELGSPIPLTSQVLEMFHSLKVDGKEKIDHSGLVQYYEKLANFEVKRKKEHEPNIL